MRVPRRDEQLRAVEGSALEPCHQVVFATGDVLVMCAGFEPRAIETLTRAVASGARGFRVVSIEYRPDNQSNRGSEIRDLCERASVHHETWTYDRENPAGAADEILHLVGDKSVHIDVSGMSRLLIVQLLSCTARRGILQRTTLWYTEALEYLPSREEVDKRLADPADALGVAMFLSTGVFGLTVVPELSSVAMQGQPIVLTAFPSWNPMQLAALRSELQASFFVSVNGVPPDDGNAWRPDAIRRLNRSETLTPEEEVRASTLDYRETVAVLLDVYRAHGQREKIIVSPTGSKMQSVAVGLVCGWLPDIQIVYPTPRAFSAASDYTRGVKTVYKLPLVAFQLPDRDQVP